MARRPIIRHAARCEPTEVARAPQFGPPWHEAGACGGGFHSASDTRSQSPVRPPARRVTPHHLAPLSALGAHDVCPSPPCVPSGFAAPRRLAPLAVLPPSPPCAHAVLPPRPLAPLPACGPSRLRCWCYFKRTMMRLARCWSSGIRADFRNWVRYPSARCQNRFGVRLRSASNSFGSSRNSRTPRGMNTV